MVCENQYGKTRYVDRTTGRMFRVQLRQGSCPDAPEAPIVVRDATNPALIHVEWKVSKDFHGSYERGVCKVVIRRDGYTLTGDMWSTERSLRSEPAEKDRLSVRTFANMDSKRAYSFLVTCANAFCDPTTPVDFPGWAVSSEIFVLPQCPDPATVDVAHQSASVDAGITIENKLSTPVSVYHVSGTGEQERGVCDPGKSLSMPSHVTHVWRVRPVGGGSLLAQVKLTSDTTIAVTELCADLSARGRELVAVNVKKATEISEHNRANVANRERANIERRKLTRRPDEVCRVPSSALSEACCAVNDKKSGDDDFATPPTSALRVKCESLMWTDAVTEKFAKPSVTTGSAPIGCLFDATGEKSNDGMPRCYYQDTNIENVNVTDLEVSASNDVSGAFASQQVLGGSDDASALAAEQVPSASEDSGALAPLQVLMEEDEE